MTLRELIDAANAMAADYDADQVIVCYVAGPEGALPASMFAILREEGGTEYAIIGGDEFRNQVRARMKGLTEVSLEDL